MFDAKTRVNNYVCSAYDLDNFIIGLTDVSPDATAPTMWNYDLCGQYPGVVGEGATVYLQCTSCMTPRRYLVVQVESTLGHLSICEIQVYVGRESILASFRSLEVKLEAGHSLEYITPAGHSIAFTM